MWFVTRNCHFFVVGFFEGKKKRHGFSLVQKYFQLVRTFSCSPKQNKWKIYVTNHVTYFCDALTELGLKIDTYPHELPLVVTANLNEIDHLYHKKTSDCIKACDRSYSSLFWPFGPVFGPVFGPSGLWSFWSLALLFFGPSGPWPFWSLALLVFDPSGFWPFWSFMNYQMPEFKAWWYCDNPWTEWLLNYLCSYSVQLICK